MIYRGSSSVVAFEILLKSGFFLFTALIASGLGLNLCARIAREHCGSLTAENRDGGGARMTLRLPLAAAPVDN